MKNLEDQKLNLEVQTTSVNRNNSSFKKILPSHVVKQTSLLALSLTATHSFATPAILIDTSSESPTNINIDKIILPELMIIDSRLKNIDNLVERRRKGLIPIIVHQDENGLDAISQAMLKYPDAATIHIVSHGEPGEILLGNTAINEDQLNTKTGSLNQWRNDKVLARPDLIVYGCNVAKGQAGQNFINKLSQLTGFDVAASTNLTGESNLGGDWELESNTGWIDASLAWQDTDIKQIQGVLATITVTSANDSGAGTLRDALDNQVTDGDTVIFSVTGTITLTSGELTIGNDIIITGPGAASLSIDAGGGSRVMSINRGLDVTISNLTITGGSASGNGGGIRSYANYLNIENSAIENNFVSYFGGGISSRSYGSLTITNSTITNNTTQAIGGGLAALGYGITTISDTNISNNTVSGNSSSSGAGGGLALGYGTATISDSNFTGNTARGSGGGIISISRGYSSLSIIGGSISNNSATNGNGGGINIITNNYRPRKTSVDSVTVSGRPTSSRGINFDGVTIDANTAYGDGGGINIGGYFSGGNKGGPGSGPVYSSIKNSTISNNFSRRSGGGLALYVDFGSNLELSNSTISGNISNNVGAGIAVRYSSLKPQKSFGYYNTNLDLINSTVANNYAQITGGGIYNSGYLSIQNSIVANNISEGGTNDLHNTNGVIADSSLIESSNYSPVKNKGGTIFIGGGNILNQDPALGVLQDNGGPTLTHQLLTGSPAIDTGNNALVSSLNEQRGTGFTRILNSTVDMGAVEGVQGVANLTPVTASAILSSIQVVEIAGVITYTILLNNPAPAVVGVTIDLDFSGTAIEGTDYIPSGRQIVIAPGAMSGSITFNIIDDGLVEPDETIIIEIVGITDAAVSGPATATVTILASGPSAPAVIPTLSNWSTILLSLLLPAFVMRRFRKHKKVEITYS